MRKVVTLVLMLTACRDNRPPAPSAEESTLLNSAEDLLNGMAANEEGPADRSASPSNNSSK